jgi:hypothetical protein
MKAQHSNTPCKVFIHPTAANPAAVARIQAASGRLVIITDGRAELAALDHLEHRRFFAFPKELPSHDDLEGFAPFDGAA